MLSQLRPALVSLGLFTLLTGIVYPLAVTGLAQVLFPRRANGSIIVRHGQPVGSELVGQPFDDPKYFWGTPRCDEPGTLHRLQCREADGVLWLQLRATQSGVA